MAKRKEEWYQEDHIESTKNKEIMVTIHYGNRAYVQYHGNDEELAKRIVDNATKEQRKRRPGEVRRVAKLWALVVGKREPK